ncbi:class I SAM-dependent methyltransferase [Nocardioides daphniae]|uniref:class I SAM-dependent methyltransferase n=1 Tax=Nocardioides daphniae TaxID=402297 RepID=UPI001EE8C984|nr:class I SAM-dependent methyltransferase [Nocardioides daphniae]
MALQTIPPRIKWAVDVMDVQPNDQVLEIGCGPGAGAELICSRLQTGKLFAIDRSESGVDRTKRRNAQHVEAGRLTVRQIDLATLRVPVKRLTKVFAFNVNLFWVRATPTRWPCCTSASCPVAPSTSSTRPTAPSSCPTS